LSVTHWARNINTEYNCYIIIQSSLNFWLFLLFFWTINHLFLRSSLKNIVDSIWLRYLFLFNVNFVLEVTEFAFPYLFILNYFHFAVLVKSSLTKLTKDWITRSQFALVLEDLKLNIENISIKFLLDLFLALSIVTTVSILLVNFLSQVLFI
jgi:hypothetical protein